MRHIDLCKITCLAAGLLLGGAALSADETKVELSDVPKPVMETVKNRFKDAKITEAAKEDEDGKVVYEVTLTLKGQHVDVTLTPEGEITVIEKTITAKDLPKEVTKGLEAKYPGASYKIVEEVIKVVEKEEKLAYYEVLLTTAEMKKIEVEIGVDGKIIKEENKDGDKDEESKEKGKENGKEKAKDKD